jgi:hypothetical protein
VNHKIITIIKWLFLVIGIGLLAGAAMGMQSGGFYVLLVLGLVFASIGSGIIVYGWQSAKKEAFLRQQGRLIQAEFQQVELNEILEINGVNPFRIVAQWHNSRSNELFIFKSANLWFDPSAYVQDRKIPVYIDPNNPSKYIVDISFLPKVHGA